jgi:hypothetical protein
MEKNTLKCLMASLLVLASFATDGQNVAINTTGAPANASTILDLSNTSSLAFLPPQVALTNVTTLAPVPGPGPAGIIVYSTTAPAGGGGIGLYVWTGTVWSYLSAVATTGWSITGNTGTNPAFNYAGTSDPQPFLIKTQGTERMRFLAAGGAGIGTATPLSAVDINGNLALGSYAGTVAAPANGEIISGKVGIGNSAPNASAILDLTNTVTNLGFELPNMTTAQRNAIGGPVKGLMVYNNTTGCINFWTGFAWENVVCPSCTGAPAVPGTISHPAVYNVNTTGNVFSVATVAGAISYTWSLMPVTAGYSITGGQGTNSATFTFGSSVGSFTLCVYDSNACGTSTTSCITFTTNNCAHGSQTFNCNQISGTSTGNPTSGSIQTWVVPNCVTQVTVTATGGSGGGSSSYFDYGGGGAIVTAVVGVTPNNTLAIVVGGGGWCYLGGGGGGGSYVWDNSSTSLSTPTLVVAGGGGGGGYENGETAGVDYVNGSTTITPTSVSMGTDNTAGTGGNGGAGGVGCYYGSGGGGAGFLSSGTTGCTNFSTGGNGGNYPNAGTNPAYGGAWGTPYGGAGGYGGGGGGSLSGGGGGGFNGGGGGDAVSCCSQGQNGSGGGGGSTVNGANPSTVTTASFTNNFEGLGANGSVTIQW